MYRFQLESIPMVKEENGESSSDQQSPASESTHHDFPSSFLVKTEEPHQEISPSISSSDQSGENLFCSEEVGYLDDSGDETVQMQNGDSPSISPPVQSGNEIASAMLVEELSSSQLMSLHPSPSYGNHPQYPSTPNTMFIHPNPPWFTSPQSSNFSSYLPPFQLQTPPLHHLSPLNSPVLSPVSMHSLFPTSPFEPTMLGQSDLHF